MSAPPDQPVSANQPEGAPPSPPANLNALWARALVQELLRAGVRTVVVCPGSRSAPLALACAGMPGLRVHTCIDERSGAFLALGAAKATGAPALVLATSGSAGAHFYPALLEAEASQVPLLCLTADRPPELHGYGAPQTLEQRGLFGAHVRAFVELMLPEGTDAALLHLRAEVARAVQRAMRAPRGPVHLNAPFREPLAPVPQPLPALSARAAEGDASASSLRLAAPARAPDAQAVEALAREIASRAQGAIAVGTRDAQDGLADALDQLSRASGWPVFADGASGLRARAAGRFVCHGDLLLRHEATALALRPLGVLRLGGGLTSKVLQQWLDASSAFTALISDEGALFDPAHAASLVIEADAAEACRALTAAVRAVRGSGSGSASGSGSGRRATEDPVDGTRARALRAEACAAETLAASFAERTGEFSEPQIAHVAARALPPGAQLFVSSSMPVRDVDAFAGALPGVRVLASRGLNGIDGLVSTAAGAALATGLPTVLLCGDLALLHDLGGLVSARRAGASLAVVVVNNDGGGIFHFLPVHGLTDRFEELLATPHGLNLSHAAALAQAQLHRPLSAEGLRSALTGAMRGGLHFIELRTDRETNVAEHRALQATVARALDELDAGTGMRSPPRRRTSGDAGTEWGSGPVSLLWLHGFTGDGSALDHLAPLLDRDVRALCPDLPGHGGAAAPLPGRAGWEATLARLEVALESLPRPRIVAGYSQGARIALGLALRVPGALDGLLLESAAPGLADPALRAERVAEDEQLARELEQEGLAAFLARWERHPVLSGLRRLPALLAAQLAARRRAQDPHGLAAALRALGQGVQPWFSDEQLRSLRVPTVVLAGARDEKYAPLARALAAALDAELRLPACGHVPNLEAPQEYAAALRALCARLIT